MPELAGPIPPHFPHFNHGEKWLKQSAIYAMYCIVLSVPWRIAIIAGQEILEISAQIEGNHSSAVRNCVFKPLKPRHLTFDSFCRWVCWETPSFKHRCHVRFIVNFSTFFKINTEKRYIFQKYRHSQAKKWNPKSRTEMQLNATDRDEADPLDPISNLTPERIQTLKHFLNQLNHINALSDDCTPTQQPSSRPSTQPSSRPSSQPSSQPSRQPSTQPSTQPSAQPLLSPSAQPSCTKIESTRKV